MCMDLTVVMTTVTITSTETHRIHGNGMNPLDSPALVDHWSLALQRRVGTIWVMKAFSTMLGMAAFFPAYFWVLHHPFFPVTLMPLTVVDRLIDFEPAALPVYGSLWVYVALGPALMKNLRELVAYGLAALALSVVSMGIFILWPTAVPVFAIDWTRYPSILFLKDVDMASNACPSLHVAFAVFTAIWLERLLRELKVPVTPRLISGLWCLGILYSTIATRQHVVLDVLAGAVLGALVAAAHSWALRNSLRANTSIRR